MKRVQSWMVLAITIVLGMTLTAAAQAQGPGAGRGFGSSTLLGLLGREQVQKEMKLSEEQTTKVQAIVEKLGAELRQQFGPLREIQDRTERRAKMTALNDEFDGKVREQLREVLEREQTMRLYQIRMQVRAVAESLANRYVAGRLELSDEQKEKLAQINKEMEEQRSELFASMREASQDQRGELLQKFRDIRSKADEKALGVLTAEQKISFDEMKGEKFELQMQGGSR